ncbi:MAG: glycosyltransferase [Helicobacter sp.]|nr:glycosyltransferase [Helicobacter sp.]
MTPKVSIIIPSLNVAPYIKECLESVVNQTLKDIEIICVDAKSSDGTLEILQEYAAKDSRIKLIISDIKSYGYQMNLGLKAARGEYIGIVESDDYIKLNMYERLLGVAIEQGCDVLKCDLEHFHTQNGQKVFRYGAICYDTSLYGKLFINKEENLEEHESAGALSKVNSKKEFPPYIKIIKDTWNMNQPGLYKREFLRKFALFFHESAGASYQDLGFWFMMQVAAKSVYFLKESYYLYRSDNENSSCNSTAKVYCLCEEYKFMEDFLKRDEGLYKKYVFVLRFRQFGSYMWNLNRVSDEFKLEFLLRFQRDFREIVDRGEVDRSYFEPWQLDILDRILENPYGFYENTYKKPLGAVERVKGHLAYKLGAAILGAKCPYRTLTLPFRLIRIIKEHRFEKSVLEVLYKQDSSLKPLSLESYGDYYEALKYKKHLSYRLGEALLKNPLTFLFRIPGIYRSFKKK